jgi:putative hydrolase of the HAD superfamily
MPRPEKITTLFIDIGGVILENGWDRNKRSRASEIFGFDLEEMNERHHLTFDTYEQGKLSLDEYLNRTIFYEKRLFSKEDIKAFMFEANSYPPMIDLLCRLKKRYGLKTAVVSNEGRELTMHRISQYRLTEFIDFFISSCFVHLRKPDEEIYRLALDVAQAAPGEVVYIDDRKMFVEVAQTLGLKGIHHKGYDSSVLLLGSYGLKDDLADDRTGHA